MCGILFVFFALLWTLSPLSHPHTEVMASPLTLRLTDHEAARIYRLHTLLPSISSHFSEAAAAQDSVATARLLSSLAACTASSSSSSPSSSSSSFFSSSSFSSSSSASSASLAPVSSSSASFVHASNHKPLANKALKTATKAAASLSSLSSSASASSLFPPAPASPLSHAMLTHSNWGSERVLADDQVCTWLPFLSSKQFGLFCQNVFLFCNLSNHFTALVIGFVHVSRVSVPTPRIPAPLCSWDF